MTHSPSERYLPGMVRTIIPLLGTLAVMTACTDRNNLGVEPSSKESPNDVGAGGEEAAYPPDTLTPTASDPFAQLPATTDKVDVLFVMDNSVSMADEHEMLIPSARRLFVQLAHPPCMDSFGHQLPFRDVSCAKPVILLPSQAQHCQRTAPPHPGARCQSAGL